jgi:dihydrodipicolinate synthase/N-acetylneuraminate lyase
MVGVGTGVHAMSITPFDRKGAIDSGLLRAHLRFLAAAGVGVYVASQGSGEGDLLSFDEKVTRQVDWVAHAFDDPRVALLETLDARRAIAENFAGTRFVQRSPGFL